MNHRQKVYPNGTFILTDIDKRTDVGDYKCVAVSPTGERAEGSLHVQVFIRPEIDGFVFPKSLQEGQRWNALCSVTKGDPPITMQWFKDGRILGPVATGSDTNNKDMAGINILNITPFSSTLNFDSLRPEHRGNYTCRASNHADSVSSTQQLIVHGEY